MANNNEVETLVINNFKGSMTSYLDGDINSGLTNVTESFGYDPFTKPGNLTWNEEAVQIDDTYSVITDLILAGKARVESGITYVYCIGHTGRVYKIQVNDPNTYNPDYDNPVLLTTLTAGSPTFTRGAFIEFFGATERIYIGHDKGVTRLDFNGTNETVVGVLGSWTQNVPRAFGRFLGKLYIGNGTNLAEIDSTATVTTYTKLTPAFPVNTQVRDIDVTPEGNFLQIVSSELALPDITSTSTDTAILLPSNSFVFKWNGTDTGYTSYTTYPNVALSANAMFGNNQYVFGYDFYGGGVWNPVGKMLTSLPDSSFGESPFPNAVVSMGNLITWMTTLPFDGHLEMVYCVFGTISEFEIEPCYFSPLSQPPTGTETDIIHSPCQILVSNFARGASSNGYTSQLFGSPKIYFSTLETSASPTTKYKFFKWSPIPTGLGLTVDGGLYQTQTQLFSKKVKVSEVRIYGEPWVINNSFTVELIGSAGTPITGSSKAFTAGSNLTIGDDFAWYTPQIAPTYAIGLRITNNGTVNHTINKVEIDYTGGGK